MSFKIPLNKIIKINKLCCMQDLLLTKIMSCFKMIFTSEDSWVKLERWFNKNKFKIKKEKRSYIKRLKGNEKGFSKRLGLLKKIISNLFLLNLVKKKIVEILTLPQTMMDIILLGLFNPVEN